MKSLISSAIIDVMSDLYMSKRRPPKNQEYPTRTHRVVLGVQQQLVVRR